MKIEIIAECAQGYLGSLTLALQLLEASAAAGADAAKFQVVFADELCTPDYKDYELSKTLEMPNSSWEGLLKRSNELDIEIIFDVFGEGSLNLAQDLGTKTVMLHATDITNLSLISKVERGPIDRVILGAGGAHFSEITTAIDHLESKQVCIMLGYQGFPTPNSSNQISKISSLCSRIAQKNDNVVIGFADHSLPNSDLLLGLSSMALGAGAKIFEKHITLAHVLKMEDHESAINPDLFNEYCTNLRACNAAYGLVKPQDDFGMSNSEQGYRKFVRRHVITADEIEVGRKVSLADFVFKRSSLANAITDVNSVVGKKAVRNLQANQAVKSSDFE